MTGTPPTTSEPGAPVRRREAKFTPAQRALTQELGNRAERLWIDADGDLSLSEAVTLAAVQIGYYPAPTEPIAGAGGGDENRERSDQS